MTPKHFEVAQQFCNTSSAEAAHIAYFCWPKGGVTAQRAGLPGRRGSGSVKPTTCTPISI